MERFTLFGDHAVTAVGDRIRRFTSGGGLASSLESSSERFQTGIAEEDQTSPYSTAWRNDVDFGRGESRGSAAAGV